MQSWEGERATHTLQEPEVKNLELALSVLTQEKKKRLSVIIAVYKYF